MLPRPQEEETKTLSVNVVRDYGDWRTPNKSLMVFDVADDEMFYVNMMTAEVNEETGLVHAECSAQEEW
jgi:hypothetical protein